VSKIVVAKNKLESDTRFEIDPEVVLKAFNEAEKEGLELIGMFHSHQTLTKPSIIDQRSMKLWGGTVWLIFSSLKDEIAAYQMRNGKVVETPILVDFDN
jgi:proteasome lid subunit RPN8/RPN11